MRLTLPRWLLLLLPLSLALGAQGQTTLATETFATDGEGTRYTSNSAALNSQSAFTATHYFQRATDNPPKYPNTTGNVVFGTNANPRPIYDPGTTTPAAAGFWATEGVRSYLTATTKTDVGDVTLNGVTVTNYNNLQVSVKLADPRANQPQADPDDYIRIQYSMDNGAWTTVGIFRGDVNVQNGNTVWTAADPASATEATYLSTDSRYNTLTQAFKVCTYNIGTIGTSLRVRVVIDDDSGTEEIAFDDLSVIGTMSTVTPPSLTNINPGNTDVAYTEAQASPVQVTSTIAASHTANLTNASVQITSGFRTGQDVLSFTIPAGSGITCSSCGGGTSSTTGTLTLTGTTSATNYQAALRSVTYANSNTTNATGGRRTVSFQVAAGSNISATQARDVVVTAILAGPAAMPYTEDFTTDGEGTRYATNTFASSAGANGSGLGWFRTNVNPNPDYTLATFSNISNGYYWYGEGTTGAQNPDPAKIGFLETQTIDASKYNKLHYQVRLAQGEANQWETPDYVKFYYRVSGGSWVLFGAFYGNVAPGTTGLSGNMQRDTDLDGTPDGVVLNNALTNIDFVLPATLRGIIDFRTELSSGGQEEMAMDLIQVTGTQIVDPAVTTTATTGVTTTTATANGNVTSDGGEANPARGVVYSATNATPVLMGTNTTTVTSGTGTGTFSASLSGLTPGTRYYVQAYVTNSANTSYGGVLQFVTTPSATVVTAPANGSLLNTTTPSYSGTAQAGATVTVYVDGTALSGTVTADGSGNWSKAQPTALSQGSHTVYATAVVTVGGTSSAASTSNTNTFTVDTVAPAAPVVTAPTNNSAVATTTPTYTGTAEANSTVTIFVDNSSIGTATVNGSGAWSRAQPSALSQGSHTVYATARDAAGNNSASSATITFTVDTTAPTVTNFSSTNGTSGSTTATSPLSFSVTFSESVTGFSAAGVTTNGSAVSTPSGSGTGPYTFTVTPVTGAATTVMIKAGAAQDAAGNQSSASSTYSLTYQPTATVTSISKFAPTAAQSTTGTATATVSFTVTFSASVSGVTTSNFTTTNSGTTVTGSSVTSVTGSGTTYMVMANTGSGNGTLQLNVANATGITPSVTNTPYAGTSAVYTITKSFAAAPTLLIQGTGGTGTDVTAFVDVAQVLSGGSAFANGLQNGSFENHNALANSNYGYNPTGASWTFNAQSGIAESGSAFTPVTPIPNGIAVAFVQSLNGNNGQFQQNLAVPNGSSYQVSFQAAQRNCCTTGDQALNVFLNGVYLGTAQPANNGAYTTFTSETFAITGAPALTTTVSTTSGSPTSTSPIPFRVDFSQSVGTTFTVSDLTGTITNGAVTNGSFSGSGAGPYTFTVTPGGTGLVTVSVAGGVASDVNNTQNSASNSVSLQYQSPTITVSPGSLPGGTVGVAYSQTITAAGGTGSYTYSVPSGALPTGLTLASNGTLAGTPTVNGSFNFTVRATDSGTPAATGNQTYTLTIARPTITLSPSSLPNGTVGVAYSQTVTAAGGTGSYTYSITAGATPSGLSISTGGVLSGTPTVSGTSTFTVTATDAYGSTGSQNYSLVIAAPTITLSPSSVPNGTVGVAYSQTITAAGGTAPYRYAITVGALPAGLTLSTGGGLSGTPTAGGSFTFTVTATDASTGSGPYTSSQAYTLSITTTFTTWTGTDSNNWFTASNWTSGVPTATVDATIPTSPSGNRYPSIGSGAAVTRNLSLGSGAAISQTGGTLDVRANLTNNGSLFLTGGAVIFGTTAQSGGPNILGSSNTRFWDLTINSNGLLLSTSATTSVQHLLTLNGAVGTQANPFVLESNATNTALVVNNGGATSGNVTVQRYISGTNVGYRHFSPAIGTAVVSSLATQGGFSPNVSQGAAYNSSATPGLVTPFPTVYGYDQNRSATVTSNLSAFDKGWVAPTLLSDALTVGKGYTVNLAGGQTFSLSGPLNNGDQGTQTLARTAGSGGYHLLGNPYPAPLDLNQVADADRSGLTGTVYTYTSSAQYTGTYSSYVLPANGNSGVGTTSLSSTSSLLPQGQGFFVQVAAAGTNGTFAFRNSQRVTSYANPTYNRTTAETRPLAQLTLQPTGSSALADNLYVYFDQYATDGYDTQLDALKLPNPTGLNVSTTLAGGQSLAIDGRAALGTTQRTVPLAVGVPAPGSYTFTVAQLLNLGTTPTYLRDLQSGALIDLALQPSYQFTVSNASALITGRFELVFSPQQALATVPAALAAQVGVYPNPAKPSASVTIELPVALARQAVQASLLDALGRVVRTQSLPASLGTHTLPLTDLSTGVYSLRLTTAAGVLVKKLVVE